MQSSPLLSLSPSFNSYSSAKLAQISDRFVEEFRTESESSEVDDLFGLRSEETSRVEEVNNNEEHDQVDDFEFAFVCRDPDSSPISADEIFYNGQIRPIFPIFYNESSVSSKPPTTTPSSIRLPLRKLLIEKRDPPLCSSSEADEFDGIQPGTYCVWTPKASPAAEKSPGRCKKSNSTGSSKWWKFRDLIHRSNSEGKETFVFLTPSTANAKKRDEKATTEASKVTGKAKSKGVAGGECVWVSEAHYVKNSAMKEGDSRRSFRPYKQDLVGFFANVNGLSRNLHPF
uniref:Uncharacterized protein n=1 Tax=Davidia involucrata TaxID=16924 RepID=A0A5B7C0I9_DAVIN